MEHAKFPLTRAKAVQPQTKSCEGPPSQQRTRARDKNKACLHLRKTWLQWRLVTAGQLRRKRLACSSCEQRVALLLRPASRVYTGTARRAHICSNTLALASKRGRKDSGARQTCRFESPCTRARQAGWLRKNRIHRRMRPCRQKLMGGVRRAEQLRWEGDGLRGAPAAVSCTKRQLSRMHRPRAKSAHF